MTANFWPKPSRRAGSVYVAVVGVTMIVAIIGVCGIQLARTQLKGVQATNDRQQARILALSAVDHAVSMMRDNVNWRADYTNDTEVGPYTLGDDSFTWKLVDPDGDLDDDASDPLWVYGIGRAGDAVWVSKAKARIDGGLPLELLRTAVHTQRGISVDPFSSLAVTGAPASADANVDIGTFGTVFGDLEATSLSGGTVTGTTTVPAELKGMPPTTVFDDYVARATALPFSGDFYKMVLAPGVNEYGGGVNADGVYYINTSGNDIDIRRSRIHGTLLIDASPDGIVAFNARCFIHPYRDDFPTLIIKAKEVYLDYETNGGVDELREGGANHNFNPVGAPYLGQVDSDQSDRYPSEILGLVHVIGDASVWTPGNPRIHGVLAVQGKLRMYTPGEIVHDPKLMANPPLGYTDDPNSTDMIIGAQSWTCEPAP